MIRTLFSPSEGKRGGGTSGTLSGETLLFGPASRRTILDAYNRLANGSDPSAVLALFGLKKIEDARTFIADLYTAPTMPAVERYDGVAYDYLDYASLDAKAKAYLQRQLIIFSNLVITSYSIHYTKLYDNVEFCFFFNSSRFNSNACDSDRLSGYAEFLFELFDKLRKFENGKVRDVLEYVFFSYSHFNLVITSYSIHYTKLYDGIDGFKEGSIILLGCGHPKTGPSGMNYSQPNFKKYRAFKKKKKLNSTLS